MLIVADPRVLARKIQAAMAETKALPGVHVTVAFCYQAVLEAIESDEYVCGYVLAPGVMLIDSDMMDTFAMDLSFRMMGKSYFDADNDHDDELDAAELVEDVLTPLLEETTSKVTGYRDELEDDLTTLLSFDFEPGEAIYYE